MDARLKDGIYEVRAANISDAAGSSLYVYVYANNELVGQMRFVDGEKRE